MKDGRFKEGDVLTENYINKIRFKKNKEKAHQYNRRTSFKVLREDYKPPQIVKEVKKDEVSGPVLRVKDNISNDADQNSTSDKK